MGWLTPPKFAPGRCRADIAASILAGGKASRLYQKLVYELQVAQDVSRRPGFVCADVDIRRAGGRAQRGTPPPSCSRWSTPKSSALPPKARLTSEVERARNQIERSLYQGLQKVGGRADQLNMYNQYLGDPGYLPKDIERYARVTPPTCKRVVR